MGDVREVGSAASIVLMTVDLIEHLSISMCSAVNTKRGIMSSLREMSVVVSFM